MRWLIDECVDAALTANLRAAGHDAVYIAEIAPRATDTEVITRAQDEGRLLLTEDKDFGEMIFRHAWPVHGLILLRVNPARHTHKVTRLLAAIDRFGDALQGRYTVIEDARFRFRPMPE